MRVLLLGMDLYGFHGSFFHIYEYAQYFVARGDEVFVASVFMSPKNVEMLEGEGVKVYPFNSLPLDQKFDLVYALHLILFPALLGLGLKYDKSILMSLSSQVPIEGLPPSVLWPQFNMLAAISPEIIDKFAKDFKIEPWRMTHVPNHIPLPFLRKADVKQSWEKSIKKVCVISNHYNAELAAIKDLAPFQVDYYGDEYSNPAVVSPALLLEYDVVITIGKTVQYCLGLGIPIYEYDKFGGCGFITLENMLEEEKTNFSGRGSGRKLEPEKLLEDMILNYQTATKEAPGLRRIALQRYAIDKLIEKQMNAVYEKNQPKPKLGPDAKLYCNTALASMGFIFRALSSNARVKDK